MSGGLGGILARSPAMETRRLAAVLRHGRRVGGLVTPRGEVSRGAWVEWSHLRPPSSPDRRLLGKLVTSPRPACDAGLRIGSSGHGTMCSDLVVSEWDSSAVCGVCVLSCRRDVMQPESRAARPESRSRARRGRGMRRSIVPLPGVRIVSPVARPRFATCLM